MDYSKLELTRHNMDIYYPLSKKVALIRRVAPQYFKGKLLDVGCGRMPYRAIIENACMLESYTGVDIENERYQEAIKPDIFWDGKTLPLEDQTMDTAMLVEVLEHVPDPVAVLREVHRTLTKDAHLLITVPFLWPLHDVPYDEYRYTPFGLKRIIEEAGFEVVEIESFGSWHSSMASMIALYVRRANFGRRRKLLSFLFKPLVAYLDRKDEQLNRKEFHDNEMITGLWCIARKK